MRMDGRNAMLKGTVPVDKKLKSQRCLTAMDRGALPAGLHPERLQKSLP
jgi:hypothetical protein